MDIYHQILIFMFTGIVEQLATIKKIEKVNSNIIVTLQSNITSQLQIDQSISHNGICLTVEKISGDEYCVTAIAETIQKTNIGFWKTDDKINIERCLQMNGRLDGHIVQGHVDTVGECMIYAEKDGSWEYTIEIPKQFASLIIEKGSICLNGISLTIFNVGDNTFTVAIIPYTYEHTNMHQLKIGDRVNIEFDIIGKYINRMKSLESQ